LEPLKRGYQSVVCLPCTAVFSSAVTFMMPKRAMLRTRATSVRQHTHMIAVALALVLVSVASDPQTPSAQVDAISEQQWNHFIRWLSLQPPNGDPGKLLAPYRDELIRQGIPAAEAKARTAAVTSLAFRRPDAVRLLWDKVYAGSNRVFADRPTELLVRAVEGKRPGTALDVGMGQGRNAVFLALNKWQVSGFDPSGEGIRQAQDRARSLGLVIETAVTTDDVFDFGRERWDLIVVTYVRVLTVADADRIWKALKPGGMVVYENAATGGNEVLNAFRAYRIVRWEDVVAAPDWGTGDKMRIQRLVAEKPGS
jgi:2-polyprenyl-3-methyl-5-hydroxy-6-metoxy-1,4-benzoquinol methylase